VPLLLERKDGTAAVFATVLELQDGAFPQRTSEIIVFDEGGAWGMEFDGIRLSAGSETAVELGGQRHLIGRQGGN
jgi:hypothetical protein